jgi:hypothetical protein
MLALAALPYREIYCPAHFGNSYEAMWPREMAAYLAELKWWGFNRYADWMTATDVTNPYASDALWTLGQEQLERKKKAFAAAAALGMGLNLAITPNHVYLDQLRPELAATKSERISGQLICPSEPAVRRIILDNAKAIFGDLARSGIRLSAFTASPYDYGGCACERCRPWVVTFARLCREIHAIAARHHPAIEPWFCTWWWTAEEYAQVRDWAEAEAPGWLKAMALHLDYDQTRLAEVAVPAGCRKLVFFHNGYGDTRQHNDIYTKYGPVIAPWRLPQTLADVAAQGAQGYQAYSEGVYDDCNKALLAGLSSGRFATAAEVLGAYAERYLGAAPERGAAWGAWLSQWGDRTRVEVERAAGEFEALSREATASWRLEQWRSKVRLEALDRAIGTPAGASDWTEAKLALAEAFWAEQERLNRGVYRLGPVRHIFAPKFAAPTWFASWQKAAGGDRACDA